jgi:hypothetical protein
VNEARLRPETPEQGDPRAAGRIADEQRAAAGGQRHLAHIAQQGPAPAHQLAPFDALAEQGAVEFLTQPARKIDAVIAGER